MKASELRIGNYVYYVFTSGNKEDHVFDIGDFEHIAIHEPAKEIYQPIPLTEDWLRRFGFEQHHDDCSNGVMYIKDIFSEQPKTWGVYPNEVGSGIVIKDSIKLEHVHQLQNLYFALTGEELNQNKEDE